MIDKVRKTIKYYQLVKPGDTILVGVSGGPDSTALIYALAALRTEMRLTLHIAHLDHLLRKDSHKDAEFVKMLGEKLDIPVTCAQMDIKTLTEKGSIEEIARNARLDFFFKTAKKIKTNKIALGHNRDDQAETVLMRILRGTGLYGLAGIIPNRLIKSFIIIRPLLEVPREEINRYLRGKKIKPRIDRTNTQDIYFRNRIRHELLPLLERRYNKNIREILAHMGENTGYDYDFLLNASGPAAKKMDIKMLQKSHPAIRRLLIRKAISLVQGDTRRISFIHMRELEDLIFNRPVNAVVDLPKDISAKRTKSTLTLYRRSTVTSHQTSCF